MSSNDAKKRPEIRNYVAKNSREFNRAVTMKDRKAAERRGLRSTKKLNIKDL